MTSMTTPDESPSRAAAVPEDPVLAELIAELTNRLEAGEPVDLEGYLGRYPEQAEPLRQLWPALRMMAALGGSAVGEPARADRLRTGDGAGLGVLGDFRLIREVGRGGMGVVYEAEQVSLGRRVALKILPMAAALDPRQLQRFQLEAHAAACLHHTHIVPVHAVGTERGVPFYVMQFIEGRSLAQLLAELRRIEGLDPADEPAPVLFVVTTSTLAASLLAGGSARPEPPPDPAAPTVEFRPAPTDPDRSRPPTSPSPAPPTPRDGRAPTSGSSTRDRAYIRTVARLGQQAAEALDHAHARGILHRDIKPGNLLVDAEGRLWVTDFGLAQIQGDHRLTLTGDILGTLRYMSPEQALGQRVVIDGRTDLYSLGVTLYELLTLRPALDGRDRAEILRRIAQEEPTPLRKLNPAVPPDLATIVQKAMAREPSERYATAKELAEDLNRFLLDRPILARPPSLLDRAAKWSRRHTGAVAAAVAVLVLAVVGLSVGMVLIARERDESRRQRELARRAVDEMYTQVAEKWLGEQPNLTAIQRDFLEKALRFYEQFASAGESNPRVRHGAVEALYRVGVIQRRLGQHAEAEASLRKAVALGSDLVRRAPDQPESRLVLAEARIGLAELYRDLGKPFDHDLGIGIGSTRGTVHFKVAAARRRGTEAEQEVSQAARELAILKASPPTDAGYRRRWALALESLCGELTLAHQLPEAEASVRAASEIWESLAKGSPDELEHRLGLARNYSRQGIHFMWWGGQDEKAEAALRQAVTRLSKLREGSPGDPRFRRALASPLTNLAVILGRRGLHAEAEAMDRRAVKLLEDLVADFPDIHQYQGSLGLALNNLARDIEAQGRYQELEEFDRRAVAIREMLAERHPDVPEYGMLLESGLRSLSHSLCMRGNVEEAEQVAGRAVLLARAYQEAHPEQPGVRLQQALFIQIPVKLMSGDHAAAVRAAEERARLVVQAGFAPDKLGEAVSLLVEEALDSAEETGHDAEFPLPLREAKVQAYYLGNKTLLREAARRAPDASKTLFLLADSLSTAPEGLRDPELALELAERAFDLEPGNGMIRQSLGWARYRAGDWDGCIESLEKQDSHPAAGDFFSAMAHWQRGDQDQAREVFERADRWLAGYEKRCEERVNIVVYTYPSMLRRIRAEAAALLGVGPAPDESRPQPALGPSGPPE